MEFIINKALTEKLEDITSIGVEETDGMIMGITENEEMIPLSKEIFELVAFALWDKSILVEACDMKFKIKVEKIA